MMQQHHSRRWLGIALGIAAVAVLVALFQPAFSSEAPAPPAVVVQAEPLVTLAESNLMAPAAEPAIASVDQTEQVEESVAVQDPSSDNCIACHTNQALLEELAEEPEVVESAMASGEG
jgi:mono/diheme cytochrome c family protein